MILPVYLYDHSSQLISTTSFIGRAQHAEWDSGQIGWIFVSHDDIIKRYGDISAETLEIAATALDSEVKDYDSYFNNEADYLNE